MTLKEKVGQMVQADLSWSENVKQLLREGRIGSLLTIQDVRSINEHQHIAVEESRLGIPILVGNDIIHGYRSIFPIPLALASSWDVDLVEAVAHASISEAIAAGTTWNFAPMVDITRDPRWGRIAESAGEDPLLNSKIGAAWVRGYQGYRSETGRQAAACVKHYAAYGAVESGKDYNTTDMSERRLREEYLPPYKAAIDAGVKTIMTSFNDLNGLPATINPLLLKQILRKEWGFEGVIISDYDSIGELIFHGVARDHKEAALRSILAGVDIDMMGNAYHYHLADLVRDGQVPEALLDEAVLRILRLKYDLDLFDHPYAEESRISSSLMRPETLNLAAEAAAKSIILLKNDPRLLPLHLEGKTIALIGPFADERQSLLGCWSFDGKAGDVETLHEAIERNLPPRASLRVCSGCSFDGDAADLASAVAVARQADVVLLAVGETDRMSGEAHSRAHLGLPGRQQELVDAVVATGKPVIAAVFTGRPLAILKLAQEVPSILLAWHGGTRAAQGLCDVLLGRVNPSAKLNVSFPRSEGQIPVYYAHKSTGRPAESSGVIQFNEADKSVYLDESNDPLFAFGFGLSYTNFTYSDLRVLTPVVEKDGFLRVSATLTNAGNFTGTEIVQLYVRDLVGTVTRPVKELKDFQKMTLAPGESCSVEFDLPAGELAFLNVDLNPVLEAGEFKVWIGPDSTRGLEGHFAVR
ncbi:beta-glucosidase BglX [Longilinea arvoryzae]|nr:beta-glucosidase BglX [Longilinea arvoryzae]